MEILKRGTEIEFLLKSDWLNYQIRIDEYGEIVKYLQVDYSPFFSRLESDIHILDDYTNMNIQLLYKYRGNNCHSKRINKIEMYDEDSYKIFAEDAKYYIRVVR